MQKNFRISNSKFNPVQQGQIDFESSKNRTIPKKLISPSDLNNNDDKSSAGSTDRAKAFDGHQPQPMDELENPDLLDQSLKSSPSNGSATDDDVGDVWDEEEASFDEDDIDGFDEEDDDEFVYDQSQDVMMTAPPPLEPTASNSNGYHQTPPPPPTAPKTKTLNIWDLENIPEEEASELLAIVNAAEEYLSSVASGGVQGKRRRSISHSSNGRNFHQKSTTNRPPSSNNDLGKEKTEELPIVNSLPTVASNSFHQRKQKYTETGTANVVVDQDLRGDNKSTYNKTKATVTLTFQIKSNQGGQHSTTIEAADSREDISMDSYSSSKNKSFRNHCTSAVNAPPQLSIFSVGETKFPESPSNSRRETLSQSSQSSRRSLRSLDRANALKSQNHANLSKNPINQFKVAKSIQIDQTTLPPSKFRTSPPPPIIDFRPGSPVNDLSPPPNEDNQIQTNKQRQSSLDSTCLSKLANDIERLLAQLDNEIPEEKIRCSSTFQNCERCENIQYIIDIPDFRKCYCNVLSISTNHDSTIDRPKSAVTSDFFSPSSDGGDLTFYSGDEGEASIMDNSAHMTCSISLDDQEIDDREQNIIFNVTEKEKADPLNIPLHISDQKQSIFDDPKSKNNDQIPKKEDASPQISPTPFTDSFSKNQTSDLSKANNIDSALGYRFTPSAEKDGSTRFRYSSYASASTRLPALRSTYVSTIPPKRSNVRVHTSSDEIINRYCNDSNGDQDEIKKKFADKIRELEKLLNQERDLRNLAERSEINARKRVEQVEWRLDQVEKQAMAKAEFEAKRESDLNRLKIEAEKARRDHQIALESLKKKQAEVISCIEDQLDTARLERSKVERECSKLRTQLNEALTNVDSLTLDKQNLEEEKNKMELKAYEYQLKVDELQQMLAEAAEARSKVYAENDNLGIQIRESQSNVVDIDRKRVDLQRQVDFISSNLNEEMKRRQTLTDRVKQLEKENELLRESSLHDEEKKKDLSRQLSRANTEILSLQTKLEQCSLAQAELLEQQKNYYTNKLTQARQENETLSDRIASLERIRSQLRQEIEDLTLDLEKANATMSGYDKRVITLDKTIREWEQRYHELSGKVVALEDELRTATSELQRSKKQVENAVEEAASLKRENQQFKEDLHDLQQHVTEITEALQETENMKRQLIEEKDELERLLDASDSGTVSRSEKLSAAESELSNVQSIIDAKVQEKVDEFEDVRRLLRTTIDELTDKVNAEKHGKESAIKQRQAVEKRIKELEVLLENANKARLEAMERVKKINDQNQDLTKRLEKLKNDHSSAIEKCAVAEKRASILQKEREEMAAALVQVERSRQELIEQTSALKRDVADHEASLSQLKAAKRICRIESAADDARMNLELATNAAAAAEEKASEAISEKISLVDELNREREKALRAEQVTLELENTIKELQNKIERLERNALMNSEHAMVRLEQTVRDLETELKQERQKAHEALRSERGSERLIKELQFQMEQERLQASRLADVVDNLEQKLKVYRRQKEEAEELANVNLARCRELQRGLDNVEGRADAAEISLSRIRAENRSRISGLLATAGPVATTEVISPVTRRTLTTVLPKRPQSTTSTLPKSRLSSNLR